MHLCFDAKHVDATQYLTRKFNFVMGEAGGSDVTVEGIFKLPTNGEVTTS